jgi:para-nitrobenzyl esterase
VVVAIVIPAEESIMKNAAGRSNQLLRQQGETPIRRVAALCVLVLSSVLAAFADGERHHLVVLTESGVVIGSTMDGENKFLGIPYAAAPVGSRRWKPPEPYGVFPKFFLNANQFGSACTQPGGIGSEDCLFLNIYTPSAEVDDRESCRRPVMVWIHGGGLQIGSSDDYDPGPLVKKGVIVVTINYRLGYLGFFAQSAIDAEGHLNGNYGLMDQQFALKWVRRNIQGFCGDPDRVTVFGESAGGQSVYAQMASPLAAGLFHGAIAESGAYLEFQDYFANILTLEAAETTGSASVPSGASIAEGVGCNSQTAECLREVPASTMVEGEPFPLFPFVDGTLLAQTIDAAFATGDFNRVPVISGVNHDEHRLGVALDYDLAGNPILNSADYEGAVTALWGLPLQAPVLALYPFPSYPSGGEALGASGTDGIFSCPLRKANQSLSEFVTTYSYEFNDRNAPPSQSLFGGLLTFPLGAYHTAELQYLFKNADFFGLPQARLSRNQVKLSNAMIDYWTQFAKTGNPNSSGEPVWLPYKAASDEVQSLLPPTPIVEHSFDAAHRCSIFWDTF